MHEIHPKIVTDENQRPIAVQLDYADWLEIEKELNLKRADGDTIDLSRFAGVLRWPEDAVDYQRRIREELNR